MTKDLDALGNDVNASMPEQVKRPNPWRKMMMMMMYTLYVSSERGWGVRRGKQDSVSRDKLNTKICPSGC